MSTPVQPVEDSNPALEPASNLPPRQASDSRRTAFAVVNYLLAIAVLIAALIWAKIIVIATLIGLGIGVILAPLLHWAGKRFHIPRAAAALGFLLLLLALLGSVGWGIFSMAESQLASLSDRLPEITQRLQGVVNGVMGRYPWIEENFRALNLGDTARSMGPRVFKGAWSGMAMLSSLVFATVIGIYTAVESRTYFQSVVEAFPKARRPRAQTFLQDAAVTVRNWFNAQLIDMAIIGLLTSIGLWAVGADYWLLFGILTGLFGLIPFVGIALVVIFAAAVTLAADPSRLPWVIGVFVVTQQLEGHVVLPLVMRGKVQLPAVPLLVFMLLLGSWAGLLGVLIAPPLFALLRLAYQTFYKPVVDGDSAALPVAPPAGPPSEGTPS